MDVSSYLTVISELRKEGFYCVSPLLYFLNLHPPPRLPSAELQRQKDGGVQQRVMDGGQERIPGYCLPGDRHAVRRDVSGHAHCLRQIQVPRGGLSKASWGEAVQMIDGWID